jgi:hypothetical protein
MLYRTAALLKFEVFATSGGLMHAIYICRSRRDRGRGREAAWASFNGVMLLGVRDQTEKVTQIIIS